MKTILALIILSSTAFGQTGDPDRLTAALAERALADHAARLKTDDRIALYQTMAQKQPQNLHYTNLLAASYVQKMRETTDPSWLERAGKLIDSSLAQDSRNYEALRIKNEIELERHNFRQVAAASLELTRLAPDDPWNWGTLGDALMELGRYPEAAEAYQKMVTLRPDLSSYNRAAWYRYLAGDAKGAIEIMQKAIAAGSRSAEHLAWCWVELGNLYARTNQLNEAARSYTQALRAFPNYHPALAALGRANWINGDVKTAIELYKRAQGVTPWPEYAAALSDLYAASGQKQEAARQIEMVDLIDRMGKAQQEKGNRALVMIYADQDRRLDRALELAEAEMTIRQDIFTWDALAWALYKNKKYDEAAKAIAEAMKLGTPEAMFHYHAGLIAAARGDKPEAAKQLKRALEINPNFDPRQAAVARKVLAEVAES